MRIISSDKTDTCFSDDFTYKYHFDEKWTTKKIYKLEGLGGLHYYGGFARPMFRVRRPDGTIIKGVYDSDECSVIFDRDRPDLAKTRFEMQFIELFKE